MLASLCEALTISDVDRLSNSTATMCGHHQHKLLVQHIDSPSFSSLDWFHKMSLISKMPSAVFSYNYILDFRSVDCRYEAVEVNSIIKIDHDMALKLGDMSQLGDILTAVLVDEQNHAQWCVLRGKFNASYGIEFLDIFFDAKQALNWLGYQDLAPADLNL